MRERDKIEIFQSLIYTKKERYFSEAYFFILKIIDISFLSIYKHNIVNLQFVHI